MRHKMQKSGSKGVAILLGHPEKAVIKLAVPMIIAMGVQTLYNLVDAFWVSGVGSKALAATGFFFPFFMLIISLGVGIGVGGGSLISRKIGEKNPEEASLAAGHSLVICFILGAVLTAVLLVFSRPIFILMGAQDAIQETLDYSQIMFGGLIFLMFNNVGNSILRAEGDANRVMRVMLLGAFLNIILDPFFIYSAETPLFDGALVIPGLNMGVAGAALATVISMAISSLLLGKWLFFDKNTYVKIKLTGFQWSAGIVRAILAVGVPATLAQASMSVMMGTLNIVVSAIAGHNGVATFITGWRIVMVAVLPSLGIGTAVISVCGAAFGAKSFDKMKRGYLYAIKFGLILELVIGVFVFFLAPQIAVFFTWSKESEVLYPGLVSAFQLICFYFPAIPFGMFTSSLFQGVGKGGASLVISLTRTIFLIIPCVLFFALVLDLGMTGLWLGIICGTWLACCIAFVWGLLFVRKVSVAAPVET